MASKHRVAITGIGLVTPVGLTTQETWQALCEGRSGTSYLQHPDIDSYLYKAVGHVTGEQERLDAIVDKKIQRKTDRFIHLGLMAAHEAMEDAGLSKEFPENRERFGSLVGVGIGGLGIVGETATNLQNRGPKGVSPFSIPKAINNMAPNWLSMAWNLQGPTAALTSACSSGADAFGHAFRMIRDGYADYMLTGGTEACSLPIALVSFGNMRALSAWQGDAKKASRPFDADRTGFVLAEGAGILLLERYDLAEKRGATIYAEAVGYGATADAHHITAMHPEGIGASRAFAQAFDDAGIDRSEIGYVNAHGTGTPMNDAVETTVLKKVFGEHIDPSNDDHILVSSTKSMTGHMIGATGGAEIAFTALALKHQLVPPTINLDTPDPACDLDYVPHKARQKTMTHAATSSFGFGGGNAVVVLKKV